MVNSNTTLVKVKFLLTAYLAMLSVKIQIQHLLKLNAKAEPEVTVSAEFKYNTC